MTSHRKPRPRRNSPIGDKPIAVASLQLQMGDTSVAERVDGISGKGEVRPPRHRTRHSEPLKLSPLEYACAYASSDMLWDIANKFERSLQAIYTVGRRRECRVAEVLLCLAMVYQLRSIRAVIRFFEDQHNWQAIRNACTKAWPTQLDRRFSSEPPTRYQFMRTQNALLKNVPNFSDDFRIQMRNAALQTATHIGCGQAKDTMTHPSNMNMIMGDATWEQSLYNGVAGDLYVDPDTGEIFSGRSDPDAKPFHREGSTPGNYIVSAMTRTEHPHERIILDSQYKPDGMSDGTVFTDMALDLFEPLGNIRGVIYDMALSAPDQDRIGSTGRHVLCKVPKTKAGKIKSKVVGECVFKKSGKEFTEVVTAVDGCPTITCTDLTGEKYLVPLTRKQTKLRGTTMYNVFQIPDEPVVPLSKRGATTRIRPFSTEQEIAANQRRPLFLRSIPLNDPDFSRLYGLREDTESMHNDYKSRLTNRRARSVGLARRELDIRGYQFHQMITATIAWKIRTDGDVSELMGRWEPPERAKRRKVA